MNIRFYAHASFRLESDDAVIVTDPYTPAAAHFDPIDEPADIVIMSSSVDTFHSDPSHVKGKPLIIDAVDIPPEGITALGVPFRAYQTMESETWDYGERDAEPNAMYWFELEDVRYFHMGDLGNPISDGHADKLRGNVDVMFALTGGQPTIALPDVVDAIADIQPRIVIPMHYYSPKGVLQILPVDAFTDLYPESKITRISGSELELTSDTLPEELHIYVLEQAR
jgi:L-ascorbate metabolism protein UlaG (beta-lactamase superfamily)